MNPTYQEPFLITFVDLKRLFWRHSRALKRVAIVCGLVTFVLLLLREPVYRAEASFNQGGKAHDISLNMKEVFQNMLPALPVSGTLSVMQSNEVLKDTVEALGLQIQRQPPLFAQTFKKIWDNITCEFTGQLSPLEEIVFSHVTYSGEKPLCFFIQFTENNTFYLYDAQKIKCAEGKIGSPVKIPEVKFTVKSVPTWIKREKLYPLRVDSWLAAVNNIRKKLTIQPFRNDKNILRLFYLARDRHLSAALLNQVMCSYQKYLKRENEELSQAQLAYLQERQRQLVKEFDGSLKEHVAYLNENLGKNGFIGFTQELETLSEPKNLYISKLFNVDAELKRFLSAAEPLDSHAKELQTALVHFQKEENRHLETLDFEQKRLEKGGRIAREEDEKYFAGLSLETAQKLVVEYTQQRDKLQAEMQELIYLRERLITPDFELSSLGVVLNDPIINDLIQKASAIALQLQDNGNRSEREQERLLESLKIQKSFLAQHLLQTVELKKIRTHLLEGKIAALHGRIVELLKSEKELLGQKLQEINGKMQGLPEKWRQESLLMLKKELGSMMINAVTQLTESKFVGQNIFQVTSKPLDLALPPLTPKAPSLFVFSFFVALFGAAGWYFLRLCHALLKGLPVTYENLHLSGFPICGKLSSSCMESLSQANDEDVETLRQAAEFLSSHLKSSEATTGLCVGGSYVDYVPALAEMLAMRGVKVLALQAAFDGAILHEESLGLWQFLNGQIEQLPIQRRLNFDYVPSGGMTRHATELMHSPRFQTLYKQLRQDYDVILIYTTADATKAEALSHLKFADSVIVSVQRETKETLRIYCEWSRKKEENRVTFIYCEESTC